MSTDRRATVSPLMRARAVVRTHFSEHPSVYLPFARRKYPGPSPEVIGPESELVIDGFTRSATTYAVYALQLAQHEDRADPERELVQRPVHFDDSLHRQRHTGPGKLDIGSDEIVAAVDGRCHLRLLPATPELPAALLEVPPLPAALVAPILSRLSHYRRFPQLQVRPKRASPAPAGLRQSAGWTKAR